MKNLIFAAITLLFVAWQAMGQTPVRLNSSTGRHLPHRTVSSGRQYHSVAAASFTLQAEDGYGNYMDEGTYTIIPGKSEFGLITPKITDLKYGLPMEVILTGTPGSFYEITFSLPPQLIGPEKNISCSYASNAVYRQTTESRNNPNASFTIKLGNTGSEIFKLGMTLTIPQYVGTADYFGNIYCTVREQETGITDSIGGLFWLTVVNGDSLGPNIGEGILQYLSPGRQYSLAPENDNILPHINMSERGNAAVSQIMSDPGTDMKFTFYLPSSLSDSIHEVPCSFSRGSVYIEETGAHYDPTHSFIARFGASGVLTLHVGINVDVPSGTPNGVYEALSSFYIEITGLKSAPKNVQMEPVFGGYIHFEAGVGVAVESDANAPTGATLRQNYPNPFNPETYISYDVRKSAHIRLTVYDVLGREIGTLVDARQEPGTYTTIFNATGLPAGMYLYQLTGAGKQTKKFLIVK